MTVFWIIPTPPDWEITNHHTLEEVLSQDMAILSTYFKKMEEAKAQHSESSVSPFPLNNREANRELNFIVEG